MNSTNVHKLFAKTVPVSITNSISTNFRSLFLTVEWIQTVEVALKKVLLITLTDESDPFFLYNLQMSEDDYQRLRSIQKFNVDFSTFPQKVIQSIQLCLDDAQKPQQFNNHMLNLILEETIGDFASTALLDVVQAHDIKDVSLLSLKFLAATESTVREHLNVLFKNLKEQNQQILNKLKNTENLAADYREKISSLELALQEKSHEMKVVQHNHNEEMKRRESTHTDALLEEKEKFLKKLQLEEDRLQTERIDKESKFKKEIHELEAKVLTLEDLNKDLNNKKTGLEKQRDESSSQANHAEKALTHNREKLKNAEKQLSELRTDLKEKDKHINHLMGNINKLNEEIQQKKRQVTSLREDLENFKKENKKSLDAAEKRLKEEQKQREKFEQLATKGKTVAKKLQRTYHEEFENVVNIEEELESYKKDYEHLKRANERLKEAMRNEKEINLRLSNEIQQLSGYQAEVARLQKDIKDQESVITYLQKLLNDSGSFQYVPPPHLAEKPLICSEGVKIQASGDHKFNEKDNTAPSTTIAPSKSLPSKQQQTMQVRTSLSGNYANTPAANGSQPKKIQMGASECSANSVSQAFNTKSSTVIASDKNANQSNIEINSNGLSAEFNGLNLSKTSTIRKPAKWKNSRLPVKS